MSGLGLNVRDRALSKLTNAAWRQHEFDWVIEFEFGLWKEQEKLDGPQTRLYAIFDGLAAVKVGIADNAERRLRNLQVANHRPLKLFASCPSTARIEAYFHAKLEPWRIRGEWFSAQSHVLAVVSLIASMNDYELDDQSGLFDAAAAIGYLTARYDEMQQAMA